MREGAVRARSPATTMATMLSNALQMWLALGAVALLALGLVIWVVGRLATRARLEIVPRIAAQGGLDALELRLRNRRSRPAEIRATYLMFASGVGMALKPALPNSAPLPLALPREEDAYLRYALGATAFQLSHHQAETLR